MNSKESKKCPKCGSTNIEVTKTWNLVSPLPDSAGRITITIMGVFKCNTCGHRWKGVVNKLKVGKGVELESGRKIAEEEEERPPKEIILDIEEIRREE